LTRNGKLILHEPPLDMFGADAVERWFTEKEVAEIVVFGNRPAVKQSQEEE